MVAGTNFVSPAVHGQSLGERGREPVEFQDDSKNES